MWQLPAHDAPAGAGAARCQRCCWGSFSAWPRAPPRTGAAPAPSRSAPPPPAGCPPVRPQATRENSEWAGRHSCCAPWLLSILFSCVSSSFWGNIPARHARQEERPLEMAVAARCRPSYHSCTYQAWHETRNEQRCRVLHQGKRAHLHRDGHHVPSQALRAGRRCEAAPAQTRKHPVLLGSTMRMRPIKTASMLVCVCH